MVVPLGQCMWAMNNVVPSTQTCPPPGQSKCDKRVVFDWLDTKRSKKKDQIIAPEVAGACALPVARDLR
jgi:hypothetical protein